LKEGKDNLIEVPEKSSKDDLDSKRKNEIGWAQKKGLYYEE
jgi:hypothetical protein